jgi:hypothetical protein
MVASGIIHTNARSLQKKGSKNEKSKCKLVATGKKHAVAKR